MSAVVQRVASNVQRLNLVAMAIGVALATTCGALAMGIAFLLESLLTGRVHYAFVALAAGGGAYLGARATLYLRNSMRLAREQVWRAELASELGASAEEIDDALAMFR